MINIVGSVGAFTVSWDPSYEPDILGYVVCGVPGSADFAVSGSNILNVGPETSFTYYPTTSGYFSVKIAAYDSFSNPKALILSDLNFSSLQTVEVLGLTQEVLSALTGELTEDHLYQALNDRLDLIDDPTTGLMTLYPRVSMTEGQYTVKLNSNGHAVGFGLASTAYNGTPFSEFMILADKFKVVHPTLPTSNAQVFTVGSINGVTGLVGINGSLVVDGSIQAHSINTSQLVVGENIAMGANAYISWANVSSKPTFSTVATSGSYADLANKPTIPTVPSYITSTKITATTIESPTVTAGTFTGGQFVLSSGGNTRQGKTSYADTTAGFWLGDDGGTPKFHIGNSGSYLKWTGTTLNYTGAIQGGRLIRGFVRAAGIEEPGHESPLFSVVKEATGVYTVTFTTPFINGFPATTVSPSNGTSPTYGTVGGYGPYFFTASFFNASGLPIDTDFFFIVMGDDQ